MQQMQFISKIDKDGNLKIPLPQEWAEKKVSIILLVELLTVTESQNSLFPAFEILASMPDDFMQNGREDSLPQQRENWE